LENIRPASEREDLPYNNCLKQLLEKCWENNIKVHQISVVFKQVYDSIRFRKIFTLQNKIITMMADAQPRTSRSSLFEWSEILPVPRQY